VLLDLFLVRLEAPKFPELFHADCATPVHVQALKNRLDIPGEADAQLCPFDKLGHAQLAATVHIDRPERLVHISVLLHEQSGEGPKILAASRPRCRC